MGEPKFPGECVGCRVISGVTLMGCGAYLGYQANRQAGFNRIGLFLISAAAIGLGTTKMLHLYPFNRKKSSAV